MDFGWPNVEIGQKMANGQLLFLALLLLKVWCFNLIHMHYLHNTLIKQLMMMCAVIEMYFFSIVDDVFMPKDDTINVSGYFIFYTYYVFKAL